MIAVPMIQVFGRKYFRKYEISKNTLIEGFSIAIAITSYTEFKSKFRLVESARLPTSFQLVYRFLKNTWKFLSYFKIKWWFFYREKTKVMILGCFIIKTLYNKLNVILGRFVVNHVKFDPKYQSFGRVFVPQMMVF